MALNEQNQDITRRYLLGQLTEDEEQSLEERFLTEDELFQDLELTRDELTQEYASGQLTEKECASLREGFLRSPAGEEKLAFAKTFTLYSQRHPKPKKLGFIERLLSLINVQPKLMLATTTIAAMLVVGAGTWVVWNSQHQSVATLTLVSSNGTRSADAGSVPSVRLREDVLKLVLTLPLSASPNARYSATLLNDKGMIKPLAAHVDTQAVVVEIDAAQLPRGQYSVTLSTIDDRGVANRLLGNYYFSVE